MSTAPLVFGNGFEGLALVPVIEVECVGRGSFRGLPTEARGPPGSDGALAFADKDGSATTGPSRAEATEPVMPSKTSERSWVRSRAMVFAEVFVGTQTQLE